MLMSYTRKLPFLLLFLIAACSDLNETDSIRYVVAVGVKTGRDIVLCEPGSDRLFRGDCIDTDTLKATHNGAPSLTPSQSLFRVRPNATYLGMRNHINESCTPAGEFVTCTSEAAEFQFDILYR